MTTLNNATLSYDVENRLTGYTTGTFAENYAYDEGNRRVEKWNSSGSDNIYFYAPGGKLLTVVQVNTLGSSPWMTLSTVSNRVYFGGMLLGTTTGYAISDEDLIKDRLGSVQPSYAYGTDTGSGQQTSPGDDFATYWKDSSSGFEYAMNRYYSAGYGRFLTVDPFGGSAHVRIPQSWNRYQYAASDPVNRRDPSGLGDGGSDDINCVDGLANDDGVYIACGGTPTFYSDSSDSADGGKDDDGDQGGHDYWDDPWDTGGITDQVQTKGTRGRNKSVSKVLRSLPAAIALAMQALQNADCASLMGTAPGSPREYGPWRASDRDERVRVLCHQQHRLLPGYCGVGHYTGFGLLHRSYRRRVSIAGDVGNHNDQRSGWLFRGQQPSRSGGHYHTRAWSCVLRFAFAWRVANFA